MANSPTVVGKNNDRDNQNQHMPTLFSPAKE